MKRLLDYDPTFGIANIFHYDESNDTFTIEAKQDLTGLIDDNRRKMNGPHGRWGDGQTVASVPLTIYQEWIADGRYRDQAFLKRWLNDPDNAVFRVRPGVI